MDDAQCSRHPASLSRSRAAFFAASQGALPMALSAQSITEAAKARAHRALLNVEVAEAQLKTANETLEKAIPEGDIEEIQSAHVDTQQAEEAVAQANADLQVVETLLDAQGNSSDVAHDASGEGLKSLLDLLHRKKQ
jgi:hypothetical protein